MRRLFTFILIFIGLLAGNAQQLNCEIIVNAEQTGQNNLSVFKTLERSLNEFVNQTPWQNHFSYFHRALKQVLQSSPLPPV